MLRKFPRKKDFFLRLSLAAWMGKIGKFREDLLP